MTAHRQASVWSWAREFPDKRTIHFRGRSGGSLLTWSEVLALWLESVAFRTEFANLLAAATFDAFRWETPGITARDLEAPFEFVLIESPELLTAADPTPFEEHFQRAGGASVITFQNLGGDAELVVPCPLAGDAAYAHLAAFVRAAPDGQQHDLWKEASRAMSRRLDDRRVWLSTAGGGVAWLHLRLDDNPKYYTHRPYRRSRPGTATI